MFILSPLWPRIRPAGLAWGQPSRPVVHLRQSGPVRPVRSPVVARAAHGDQQTTTRREIAPITSIAHSRLLWATQGRKAGTPGRYGDMERPNSRQPAGSGRAAYPMQRGNAVSGQIKSSS